MEKPPKGEHNTTTEDDEEDSVDKLMAPKNA